MEILMVLVAVVATAQCNTVLSVDPCSWGESYWCSQLKVAKQCGAVQHCMTTVWKNQQPNKTLDDSDLCQFCETIITDVRGLLENEKDKQIIQQYLESACAIIPDPSLAAECKAMVDDYLDVVLSLIASELDPQMVCSMIKLCNSDDSFKETRYPRTSFREDKKAEDELCTHCVAFFMDIKEIFTNQTTLKKLEDYIQGVFCSRFSEKLREYCINFVDEYLVDLYNLTFGAFNPRKLCLYMELCPNSSDVNVKSGENTRTWEGLLETTEKNSRRPTSECVLCEVIILHIDDMLSLNSTQQDIEMALREACIALPDTIKLECKDFVDEYTQAIINLLKKEMTPSVVCGLVGLCPNFSGSSSVRVPPSRLAWQQGEAIQCSACEALIIYFRGRLEENSTLRQIEKLLGRACELLPTHLRKGCVEYVQLYAPAFVQIVAQVAEPTKVCTFLGMCNNQTTGVVSKSLLQSSKSMLVGNKKCTWGPSYWCQTMDNAVQCNAVEHCRKHVWGN